MWLWVEFSPHHSPLKISSKQHQIQLTRTTEYTEERLSIKSGDCRCGPSCTASMISVSIYHSVILDYRSYANLSKAFEIHNTETFQVCCASATQSRFTEQVHHRQPNLETPKGFLGILFLKPQAGPGRHTTILFFNFFFFFNFLSMIW